MTDHGRPRPAAACRRRRIGAARQRARRADGRARAFRDPRRQLARADARACREPRVRARADPGHAAPADDAGWCNRRGRMALRLEGPAFGRPVAMAAGRPAVAAAAGAARKHAPGAAGVASRPGHARTRPQPAGGRRPAHARRRQASHHGHRAQHADRRRGTGDLEYRCKHRRSHRHAPGYADPRGRDGPGRCQPRVRAATRALRPHRTRRCPRRRPHARGAAVSVSGQRQARRRGVRGPGRARSE